MSENTSRLSAALGDRYAIERELGAGGMATVYLAEDLKHKRKVAVKVLKPELAAVLGADRFVQEIETTASLQHPHILPLFDSGQADGLLYYVMPYIEGETLREKLDRETQLGIDEAVRITTEVADALDYAHRNGVIHRDIKPENILLHDGRPMVADFGIALAVSAAAGGRMTETGLSLGTPHYMSPEQATADKDITNRSDIYSLACVTYEMLAGNPPHTGSSAQQIIMKIVTEEATQVTNVRKSVPPNVAAALTQALQKLPADRFGTAKEFAEALTNPAFAVPTAAVSAAAGGSRRNLGRFAWPAVAAAAVALAAFGWLRPTARPLPVMRQGIVLGAAGSTPYSVVSNTAIAPDGSAIVYVDSAAGGNQLWIKERDRRDPAPIAGAVGASLGVTFSPDGEWIAYVAGTELRKISRAGGAPVTLADSAGAVRPAWLDDGTIVFAGQDPYKLYRVNSVGGPVERVTVQGERRVFADMNPLPHGGGVLVTTLPLSFESSDLLALDLETGELKTLVAGAGWGAYASSGYLVYALRNGGLWAAPIDLDDLSIGQAVPLEDGIRTTFGLAEATLGADGTLLYVRGASAATSGRLVWVDRNGKAADVDPDFSFSGIPLAGGVRLSPTGDRVALTLRREGGLAGDVYVKRLPTGPAARVTFEGPTNRRPSWSPDGKRLVFISDRAGDGDDVWAKRADGTGAATLLVDRPRQIFEAEWSRDGRWLVYRTDDDEGGVGRGDILAIPTEGDTTPVPLVATPAEETGPAVSWDSNWLAYASDETGRKEIYVRPFPNTDDGKWLISTNGGAEAAWARSGRELFYRDASGNMVVASVNAGNGSFEVLTRQNLFNAAGYVFNDDHRYYDVSADAERFLMVDDGSAGVAGDLIMVTNFDEVVRRASR
ncbi:MAG: protein kinase [Gemmatimonadales bacterium]|jgi:serine/threonine-protein kinase